MKKILLQLFALMVCSAAYGQMNLEAIDPNAVPNAELAPFNKVDIVAPMIIRLERVNSPEECKIKYDLKGETNSKFNFSVKDSTLYIRERMLLKRTTMSEAVIYYYNIDNISVSRSKVTFETPIALSMFDIKLSTEAVFVGEVDCDDLKLSATTRGRANISGKSKYVSVEASTNADVDLQKVEATAAWIDASNGATVEVSVSERLEVTSSIGAVVRYHGEPAIMRMQKSLIGGEILPIETDSLSSWNE